MATRQAMGVLDTQSIREHLANRKLGRKRLERRRAAERGRERRRPNRGATQRTTSPEASGPHRRPRAAPVRRGGSFGAVLGTVARLLLAVVLLPLQLLLVLLRPRDLVRRMMEAPGRVCSGARRVRMASRDPDSGTGKLWETARLSAFFVREELADMQDGFPRPSEVAASILDQLGQVVDALAARVGLAPDDRHDNVRERLFHAASLGVIAAAVVVGLFVATYQGIERFKTSERMAVAEIHLGGLERTSHEDLGAALRLSPGDNLLELELEAIADRARELPWVADAVVSRDLRGQAVSVHLVEHRPALILGGSPMQLVDDRGVVFKTLQPGDPLDMPVLMVDGEATPELIAEASAGALEVLHALSPGRALNVGSVSELRYDASEGFTLVTMDGLPVRLGRRDFADRLGRLEIAVSTGALPLDALASVDAGLRDRLVAVPLTTRKARRTVRAKVEEQPVDTAARRRMLHLERIQSSMGQEVEL